MKEDFISIITACYNSERYLRDTVISVLEQEYTSWEWIIVDDNSTDKSVEIIREYAEKDNRIKLISLSENRGAAFARNKALEIAQGRYITFLDSDDIWYKIFLTKAISFLQEHKEEVVYASYKRVNENLEPILADFIAEDNITYKRLLDNCPIPMLTAMYDSKRIGKIIIPDVERREDYAMWLNMMKLVSKARAIKEVLAIYRIRENSYSRNKLNIAKAQFMVYYDFLNMSLIKSSYYTFKWAYNGMKKYGKL